MEPLISKTPLPRPLEQEQWTVDTVGEMLFYTTGDFPSDEDLQRIANAHNTSLRALQEELAAKTASENALIMINEKRRQEVLELLARIKDLEGKEA